MSILLWIVFGAIAGWLASVLMKTNGRQGTIGDILLGIVGAIIGGFVFGVFGQSGVTGFNLYSIIVAVVGSVIIISLGRVLFR
jgi:uncharacterized membrane protein YeaQ/YmgE (transglycosylase-associated protein family)